ncbi:MAG TPA: hypothetical protein VGR37_11175 [Longimicrobiaceae bacterium]|nr:hypothetical protein [Longimicrobiaceae bacterium]
MRARTLIPAAVLSLGMFAAAGCSEQSAGLVAPESEASFQRQTATQGAFGGLIAALNNINAQIIALNNIDIQDVDVRVVDINTLNLTVQQVRILNNVLNNNNVQIDVLRNAIIEVLSRNDITLQDFLNNNDIDVNVDIGQVVAIDVLSGDLIIFVQ